MAVRLACARGGGVGKKGGVRTGGSGGGGGGDDDGVGIAVGLVLGIFFCSCLYYCVRAAIKTYVSAALECWHGPDQLTASSCKGRQHNTAARGPLPAPQPPAFRQCAAVNAPAFWLGHASVDRWAVG